MPEGNKHMYGKAYIMKQMSKQGEFSDANESALYREKLEFTTKIESSSLIEAVPSESGNKHMGQASMIMAAAKQQGINSPEPK